MRLYLTLTALLCVPAAPAWAGPFAPEPPAPGGQALAFNPTVDVPLTLAVGAVWGALYLLDDLPAATPVDQEPPDGIDGLAPHTLNESIALVSDVALYSTLALGWGVQLADGGSLSNAGGRTVLYAEGLLLTGLATELTKRAVERPRPYTYGTGYTGDADDALSFFSGHSSWTAAAGMYTARSLDLTHALRPAQRAALYGGAALLTGAVGGMRIAAGKHFPTDVLVGATVGGAIGWLVPELHRSDRVSFSAAMDPDGGLALGVAGRF